MVSFPDLRLRRVRELEPVRALTRETRLSASSFIYPLFVCEGEGIRKEIPSMPGNYHLSVDRLVEEVQAAREDGVTAVILFGIPAAKDERGSGAWDFRDFDTMIHLVRFIRV